MFNILVVEDEKNIRKLMSKYLVMKGYNVLEAGDGEQALDVLDTNHIDLIITDIMMPKMDGIELTKDMRSAGFQVPILIITARETLNDKKIGFLAGADDYMVKPIDMEEMLIRVAALLRRSKIANEKKLKIGKTILDYDTYTVSLGKNAIELPKKEFQILFRLLSQPKKIFTRRATYGGDLGARN